MSTDILPIILYAAFLFAMYELYKQYLAYLRTNETTTQIFVAGPAVATDTPAEETK